MSTIHSASLTTTLHQTVTQKGGWLSAEDVMKICTLTPAALVALYKNNAILALISRDAFLFPAFQMVDTGVNPHVQSILEQLTPHLTDHEKILFFVTPRALHDGEFLSPADWLKAPRMDSIMKDLRSFQVMAGTFKRHR